MIRTLVAAVLAAAVVLLGGPPAVARSSWAPGEPTALSSSAQPSTVVSGQSATLTGTLTDPATGAGIPGAAVRLESLDPATRAWTALQLLTTDPAGAVSAAVTPQATTTFRLHYGEPGAPDESAGGPVTVEVRLLTAALEHDAVRVGRAVAVRGAAAVGTTLRLQRRVGDTWATLARTRPTADGSFALTATPGTTGFWRLRVVRDADPAHPATVVTLPRLDVFRLHTYAVTTRGRVWVNLTRFRALVAATYADPRGWRRAHQRFREVARGGAFTVVLSQPRDLPTFSRGCSSAYSCRVGRYVVINAGRWARGSLHFTGDLTTYRQMLVNHETGHWLGLGHAGCPRPGALAPVMQQQSKGMQGCRPNAWPLPGEVRRVS